MEVIRFVIATRVPKEEFFSQTAIGRSLSYCRALGFEIRLSASNTRGLPAVYNAAIEEAAERPAILVFVHDDVMLLDYFWPHRLRQALDRFPIVGLAGNRRRLPGQSSWAFLDDRLTRDDQKHFSGVVAHGHGFPPGNLSVFGPAGLEVKLLDGLFIAVESRTLIESGIRFDERFDFHFYDLDFCRQAEMQGISMGTMALSVIHGSRGDFRSEGWRLGYAAYIQKWGA